LRNIRKTFNKRNLLEEKGSFRGRSKDNKVIHIIIQLDISVIRFHRARLAEQNIVSSPLSHSLAIPIYVKT